MMRLVLPWLQVLALLALLGMQWPIRAQNAVSIPAPAINSGTKSSGPVQTVVLAGGCFWGIQGLFEHVRGVRKVLAGYAGGDADTATYAWVSSGLTGHAEAVQISFEPAAISLGEILQIYFSVAHDPTQLNRQWPDVGPQYRSAIFYGDAAQKKLAEDYIAQLTAAGVFRLPIVTRIDALGAFYPAEAHHQDYLLKHPRAAYIVSHDLPKLRELKRVFPARFRDQAITIEGTEQTLLE